MLREHLSLVRLHMEVSEAFREASFHLLFVNARTRTKIKIVSVNGPEGPIIIDRYNPTKGKGAKKAKRESMSAEMIWRIANAFSVGAPINFDRVLGGSYNTRSALEALMAHTPEFYHCFPGRIEVLNSQPKIKKGHKHLIWTPNNPHQVGVVTQKHTHVVISEVPTADAIYESVNIPDIQERNFDINLVRRHAQIQVALMLIGLQLGSKIWVAYNDRTIEYNGKKLAEMEGVIARLEDMQLLNAYQDAVTAARLIDVIWFRNNRFMPAVFEVEHSTGVITGLSRMKNFKDSLPPFESRWVIVAPDELREKVVKEANKEQFKLLEAHFLSYTSVEELYSLCQRRKIRGVNDDFLDSFMEPCLALSRN
jgi:type II restriction enzyme